MNIETLNCPNCGAGVASDHTECEFCRTRLKTVACPKCFGLMFFGNRFCGHCGAAAVDAKTADGSDLGICPRCKTGLDRLEIDSISLSECTHCGGLWSDVATFEKVCSDREQQSATLAFFGNRPAAAARPTPIQYVPCPECKELMNRSNFARSSGVIVDLCKEHGVPRDRRHPRGHHAGAVRLWRTLGGGAQAAGGGGTDRARPASAADDPRARARAAHAAAHGHASPASRPPGLLAARRCRS